jgi:hypothetical protein
MVAEDLLSPGQHPGIEVPAKPGPAQFDLSRYMGASLTMVDRHYGHLARTDASTRSSSSTP